MEVATTRSILTLQAINVIGSPFIHSEIDVAATLTFPKRHRSIIQKRRSNGGPGSAGAEAHFQPNASPQLARYRSMCGQDKKQCALQLIPLLFHVRHPASRPEDVLAATGRPQHAKTSLNNVLDYMFTVTHT